MRPSTCVDLAGEIARAGMVLFNRAAPDLDINLTSQITSQNIVFGYNAKF
jgi:hypothetical protein